MWRPSYQHRSEGVDDPVAVEDLGRACAVALEAETNMEVEELRGVDARFVRAGDNDTQVLQDLRVRNGLLAIAADGALPSIGSGRHDQITRSLDVGVSDKNIKVK